ncbi:MAG: 30S ribosomal protein S30e [Ignisphaera sp.]|uniref:30S ribosomal protein S30e n=1 Tax=Ignisphaera aggregans TaxID=334771 RepID=A0A7C4JIK9_9CREN
MPSHGSLTKAGKVRGQTPKIQPKPKRNLVPRTRNRREYWIRHRKAQGLPVPTVVPPSCVPRKKVSTPSS